MATSTRRTRARRGEGDKLREDILEAALELLLEKKDADAVSIRAVAERVGVTPPSIYLHFGDKTELLFAVSERQFQELDDATQAAAATSDDLYESLKLRGKAYVRFGLEHPEHYRLLFMEKPHLTPADYDPADFAKMAGFNHLIEHVTACLNEGIFRPDDPVRVSMLLWINVHGVVSLMISKPDFPWPPSDDLVDYICDRLFDGLKA